MSWKTLTSDDVRNRLSGAEYDAITAVVLADGQTAEGVVAAQISAIVKAVRGFVAACPKNILGDGDAIPDELEDAAVALVRERIFTRVPGLEGLYTESRREEAKEARRLLRDVANCKFTIVQPETATTDVLATPEIETVAEGNQGSSREDLKGL